MRVLVVSGALHNFSIFLPDSQEISFSGLINENTLVNYCMY